MSYTDEEKNKLRKHIKGMRRDMDSEHKADLDEKIFLNLINCPAFKSARTVLVYYSMAIEVSTQKIIEYCIKSGKKTALPRCGKQRQMDFYYYDGRQELEISGFGIPEPLDDPSNMVKNLDGALCIVPGLAFDLEGYRLGYGGGYYDRFLSDNANVTALGICYNENIYSHLLRNEHDRKVSCVVTEKRLEAYNG